LAAHVCEEGHQIDWDQTDILQFGPNAVYRKYEETARMLCMSNPISQSSVDVIRNELKTV
jgi:hypothetical protein